MFLAGETNSFRLLYALGEALIACKAYRTGTVGPSRESGGRTTHPGGGGALASFEPPTPFDNACVSFWTASPPLN
jgi:hypothetical protein